MVWVTCVMVWLTGVPAAECRVHQCVARWQQGALRLWRAQRTLGMDHLRQRRQHGVQGWYAPVLSSTLLLWISSDSMIYQDMLADELSRRTTFWISETSYVTNYQDSLVYQDMLADELLRHTMLCISETSYMTNYQDSMVYQDMPDDELSRHTTL